MKPSEYLAVQQTIESIFQMACFVGHDVIIFPDLGCSVYKIPIDDIIEMLNLCILKYNSMFKFIVFAIPINDSYDMKIFASYSKDLIKPQNIFNEQNYQNDNEQNYQNNNQCYNV